MNERAERIKKLMQDSGKTYMELEKLTGVSKSSLQRYASGVTSKIPLEVVEKLEKAFGVPRGYIAGWQPEPEPEELGAMAARMLMDPAALQLMHDYMELSEADRVVVRSLVSSLAEKKKD